MLGRVHTKFFRWFMAINVSMWMAGAGCLFGCSNMEMPEAKQSLSPATQVVVAGTSCAAMHAHNCCAKRSAKKSTTLAHALPSMFGLSDSIAEACPLALNSTAAVSKVTTDLAATGSGFAVPLTVVANNPDISQPVSSLPSNRGPTYLRCCVFLI